MIYVLVALLALSIVSGLWERQRHAQQISDLHDQAASERKGLEDRLMALTQPSALTHVKAVEDPEPAIIRYVDEEPGTDTVQRRGASNEA